MPSENRNWSYLKPCKNVTFCAHLYQINSGIRDLKTNLDNPNNVIIIPWILLLEGLSAVCLKHFQVFPFCIQVVLELCLRSSFFVRSGLISSLLHSVWKSLKKFHLPPYKFCLLFRENVHIWIFEAKNFKVPELLPSKFKWDLFWGFANTAFFVLLEYYYPLYNFISSSASVFNSLWLHLINRECLTLLFCSNALILSSNSKRCKVETLSLLFPFSYFFFVFIWWNLRCWLNLTF